MRIKIAAIACLLYSICLFSQKKGDVFLNKDSLSLFQFVSDKKVFYTLYSKNGSPFILRKTRRFLDNFDIGIEMFGLGDYYIKDDTLNISFTKTNNFKDSISISYFKEKGKDKRVKVVQKNYFSRTPNDMVSVAIGSKGSTYSNLHEHDVFAPIDYKSIPYKITVWSSFSTNEIEIKKYKNTLIELFTNEYYSNKYPDDNIRLRFPLKNLIDRTK